MDCSTRSLSEIHCESLTATMSSIHLTNNDVLLRPVEASSQNYFDYSGLKPSEEIKNDDYGVSFFDTRQQNNANVNPILPNCDVGEHRDHQHSESSVNDLFQHVDELNLLVGSSFEDENHLNAGITGTQPQSATNLAEVADTLEHCPDYGLKYNLDDSAFMPDPLATVRLASTTHIGNNRFYVLICKNRDAFLKASSEGDLALCDQIARNVIRSVCEHASPQGRFLECRGEEYGQQSYFDLGQGDNVVEMVKWALREPPVVELSKYFDGSNNIISGSSNTSPIPILNPDFQDVLSHGPSEISKGEHESVDNFFISHRTSWSDSFRGDAETYSEACSTIDDLSTSRSSSNQMFNENISQKRNAKKQNSSLKRRGVISSLKTVQNNGKKINLADRRFVIDDNLSKMVANVFATNPTQTDSTGLSDSGYSRDKPGGVDGGTASNTSGIRRLGSELGRVEIQDDAEGSTKLSSTLSIWNEKMNPTIAQAKKQDGTICNMGPYDVLCTSSMSLYPTNHIGNNRLRTMLHVHKERFHHPLTTLEAQKRIASNIVQDAINCGKGKVKFLKEQNGEWIEIGDSQLQQIVFDFLLKCEDDPSLSLPALGNMSSFGSLHEQSKSLFHRAQNIAARELSRKRKKKVFRGLDSEAIEKLQSKMIKKGDDTTM